MKRMSRSEWTREMVVIIRPSFKKLCGEDACRAALFNHLLYWIAQKAKGQPEEKVKSGEICWYGSAQEIWAGLDESWSLWKVRKEIRALAQGTNALIGQRHNPRVGWDRTYQYFFGEEQGQILHAACLANNICLHHLSLPTDMLHLLETVGAFTKNSRCICEIQQGDSLDPENAATENNTCLSGIQQVDLPDPENAATENNTSICGSQQMDLLDPTNLFAGSSNAIPKITTKDYTKITAKDYTDSTHSTAFAIQIETQQESDREKKKSQHQSAHARITRDKALTAQGQHILKLYEEFKGHKVIRNAATLLAANQLGDAVGNDEDFLAVLKTIAKDPFLKEKQVRTDLDFVYRKYDGFLDIVEYDRRKRASGASMVDYNEVAGMTDEQRAAYKQQQREKWQQALPPGIDSATLMKMKPEERIALFKTLKTAHA